MEEAGGPRRAGGAGGCGLSVWAVAASRVWSLVPSPAADLGVFPAWDWRKWSSQGRSTVCSRARVFCSLGEMPGSGLWASSRMEG